MVQAALDEGDERVTGGHDRRRSTAATAARSTRRRSCAASTRTHRIARDEVFGPVLSVIEVDSLDEAIDIVNESEYGLSAAIYTATIAPALQAVDRINTGIVYVNAPTIGAEIHLPFGGTKHTGNGYREAGQRGHRAVQRDQDVYVDYSGRLQQAQIDNRPPVEGGA